MKFQCSCGAKYALDIVPGMGRVTFVCQVCGQDYSDIVNDLIRQQTAPGQPQAPAPAAPESPATPAPPPAAVLPAAEPVPAGGSRLRISREQPVAAPQAAQEPASKYCSRHRTELTTDQCQVCHKPICPQCIDTFGPYCSPFCRNKVEGPSMTAPSWGGRKFTTERAFWRKTGKISTVIGLIAFAIFGFWFWYAWIGSVPKVYFSVRWNDISHSGGSWIADGNQLVFLHGGTLARYDLQAKRKIWSLELVGQEIDDRILQDLPPFPAMHLLQLRQTRVTARGLRSLNRHPLFRVLNLFPPFSPSLDLTELPRLRSLTGLNVYNAQSLRCAFGSFLLKLPNLGHLMLDCAGVLRLKGRLPKSMALLSLRAPTLQGDFAIPAQVEMLGLHLHEASDSDVENLLRDLKVVRSLDLSATPVTEAFVRRAVERWPMKSINVSQTNMSRTAVTEFAAAHPNLSILPAPANNQPTSSSVSLAPQDSELSH